MDDDLKIYIFDIETNFPGESEIEASSEEEARKKAEESLRELMKRERPKFKVGELKEKGKAEYKHG